MGATALVRFARSTKTLLPLIIIACFEEVWQLPGQDSPGDIEVVFRMKYLDQVIPDNEFVPLFLGPGPGRHDIAWSFCDLPEPGYCLF